jgi:hypothetical protein
MYRKDYILRVVEEIARFVAKILGLLKEGKHEEAEYWLEKGYHLLKSDRERLLNMVPGELIEELEKNQGFDFVRMELIADLIYAEAEILAAKDDDRDYEMFVRALALYEYIDKNHNVYSFERNQKILTLLEKIEE